VTIERKMLKIKLCFNRKKEKEKNCCASDKKLFLFIFESYACHTIKRDTAEPVTPQNYEFWNVTKIH
jgi:hypothetical protein